MSKPPPLPHMLPPDAAGDAGPRHGDSQAVPPALELARRIRREQGNMQVQRFLEAMEPFLAPFERQSIAEQMGVSLPAYPAVQNYASAPPSPERPWRQMPYAAPLPPPRQPGGMNPMLLQLLGQMSGGKGLGAGAAAGGMNPAMLAQLLGSMNAPR